MGKKKRKTGMSKKILIGIGIAVVIIALLVGIYIMYVYKPAIPEKEQLLQRVSEFNTQYQDKKAQGYDVTEAEDFARKAKQAFDKKDYRTANKFLDEAFEALERAKIPIVPIWTTEGPIYEIHPYYHNGTFKAITNQIPSLADLGIKTIYLMPIWEHIEREPPSNYIYLINDYYKIDPVYGTEEELRELVGTVHEHDMKIIFDLVTGCAPPGSIAYNNNWTFSISLSELQSLGLDLHYGTFEGDDIVYSRCKSDKYVKCELFGRIIDNVVVLYHYPTANFGPSVDRTNPEVIDYFKEVAEYYVREYGIDGWRVDAPANNWNPDIISGDHSILKLLRGVKKAITEVKPDAILLAETPFVSQDPILDEMCEASYSHGFLGYVYYKIIEGEGNSKELTDMLLEDEKIWHKRMRIRYVESHDTERINKLAPQLNKPLLVLISAIPGVPMIQAGQEIGARNPYFPNSQLNWANGDYELREFYKRVFEIRNSNNALKYGTIENIWKSGDKTFAYLRCFKDEKVIVVINFLNKEATSTLDLSFLDKRTVLYDELNKENFAVDNPADFKITLSAYGSRILVLQEGK